MVHNDEQPVSNPTAYYVAQLHKARQNLKQFIPKYHRLVEREERLRHENRQLQHDVERFNQRLSQCEHDVAHLQQGAAEFLALLHQLHHEERRSPDLHARPPVRQRFERAGLTEGDEALSALAQEVLPLNIWLVSQNRFIEQIISYYTRKRERLLIIKHCDQVRHLIEAGFFPDLIVTGAYDFGLDDPFQRSFSSFLDQAFRDAQAECDVQTCFLVTISASVPAQVEYTALGGESYHRQCYISKLHGLQVTISEVRFFLELRRCQPDIMAPELTVAIDSLEAVTPLMKTLQTSARTGLLAIFSAETPPDIRWAFQLFYLKGKLVKTEHTLEASAIISDDGLIEPVEKDFIFTAFDSQYRLNPPQHALFFPLYDHTVRREVREESVAA